MTLNHKGFLGRLLVVMTALVMTACGGSSSGGKASSSTTPSPAPNPAPVPKPKPVISGPVNIEFIGDIPQKLVLGQTFELKWLAKNASECELSSTKVASQGSVVWEAKDIGEQQITLICSNSDTRNVKKSTLTVSAPELESIEIRNDANKELTIDNSNGVNVISDSSLELAKSSVQFSLSFVQKNPQYTCQAAGGSLKTAAEGHFKMDVPLAYFKEMVSVSCQYKGTVFYQNKYQVTATDPSLEFVMNKFLSFVRKYPLNNTNDPNADLPRINFYYEINRLLSFSHIYLNSEVYGVAEDSERYTQIENYLINAAETYFQPCVNYDFYHGEMSQCRSPERIGSYYRWRNPMNDAPQWRTTHEKVEWRAAGGVSQAVKALLLKHANEKETCEISDLPGAIRAQSISCRAKNVRRLLLHEVWNKWSDLDYVTKELGFKKASAIQYAEVSHYLSWIELIADLFNSTKHISHHYKCTSQCWNNSGVPSVLPSVMDFVEVKNDGYVNITCKREKNASCRWHQYQFADAGGVDISHISHYVHIVSTAGNKSICTLDKSKCFTLQSLVNTARDLTWSGSVGDESDKLLLPKFDVFINGHCKEAFKSPGMSLYEFCQNLWLKNGSTYHRQLFGFVDLGRYDRTLMIRLRQATDTNRNGELDFKDVAIQEFVTFLYFAMHNPTQL